MSESTENISDVEPAWVFDTNTERVTFASLNRSVVQFISRIAHELSLSKATTSLYEEVHTIGMFVTFRSIMSSYHPFKIVWDWFILLSIIYTTISLPFIIGFASGLAEENWLIAVDSFIALLMTIDIAFTFRTAVELRGGDECFDKKIIRSRYVSSAQFKLDLISTVPIWLIAQLVLMQQPQGETRSLVIINVLKLPMLIRGMRMFTSSRIKQFMSSPQRRIARFMMYFIYVAHILGCSLFFIGKVQPGGATANWYSVKRPDSRLVAEYTDSLYWALETLLTVGFGDNVAFTDWERLFMILCIFCTGAIYSANFGNMAGALDTLMTQMKMYHFTMDRTAEFCQVHHLPNHLRKKLTDYTQQVWNQSKGLNIQIVTNDLPHPLKVQVLSHVNAALVNRVPLFKHCLEWLSLSTTDSLTPEVCLQGDYVFRSGDISRDMYFVQHGAVEICMQDPDRAESDEIVVAIIDADVSPLPFFGEIGLLLGEVRTASVRAARRTTLMRINEKDFLEMMRALPTQEENMREAAIARLRTDIARITQKRAEQKALIAGHGKAAAAHNTTTASRQQRIRSITASFLSWSVIHCAQARVAGLMVKGSVKSFKVPLDRFRAAARRVIRNSQEAAARIPQRRESVADQVQTFRRRMSSVAVRNANPQLSIQMSMEPHVARPRTAGLRLNVLSSSPAQQHLLKLRNTSSDQQSLRSISPSSSPLCTPHTCHPTKADILHALRSDQRDSNALTDRSTGRTRSALSPSQVTPR